MINISLNFTSHLGRFCNAELVAMHFGKAVTVKG